MDPALIQALIGLGTDPQQQEIARKQKMIDMLRQKSMQPAEMIHAGRQVLPNYGGAIGNALAGYQAQKMQGENDTATQALTARQRAAQAQYLDALTMALRRPIPGSNTPMLPPDGMEDR